MKNYQYVLDIETPFIRKLYNKEDNYKVELLTPYGILEELKKLQEEISDLEQKLALTGKALELACEECLSFPCSEYCGTRDECETCYYKETYTPEKFKTKAKEMLESE